MCLECFDRLQEKHPDVRVDAYVDDITVTAEGSGAVVLEKSTLALRDLVLLVENELGCAIEWKKAAVVASSDTLIKRLKTSCGIKGDEVASAVNLGVDFSCEKSKRKCGKNT